MPLPCCLSGLPDDPLVDAEVWRYDLVLGTPAAGNAPAQPFDLSGSDLAIVLRTVNGFALVATLSTRPDWPGRDGAITITDGAAGKIRLASDPWQRAYRVPIVAHSAQPMRTLTVRGDILRLTQGDATARPEYLGYLEFPIRASTTQWPAPAS